MLRQEMDVVAEVFVAPVAGNVKSVLVKTSLAGEATATDTLAGIECQVCTANA